MKIKASFFPFDKMGSLHPVRNKSLCFFIEKDTLIYLQHFFLSRSHYSYFSFEQNGRSLLIRFIRAHIKRCP